MDAEPQASQPIRHPLPPVIAPTPAQAKVSSLPSPEGMANQLTLMSLGLGLVELLAAPKVTKALGVPGYETLVRAFGVREIASGGLIRANRRAGTWSRVFGDALDIAALVAAFPGNNRKRNLGLALAFVGGAAALDFATARALDKRA